VLFAGLYVHLGMGAFRNLKGALLAGAIIHCFPALLMLVRTVEFLACLWTGEPAEHPAALRREGLVFGACFAYFAAQLCHVRA
jgi:hypothetical protein